MRIMNKTGIMAVFILLFAISMVSAETRLDINVRETVNQNVSYGYNFTYAENSNPTDYCTIIGIVNVSNPNADTMSDIYLTFFNGSRMTSNFSWMNDGGRIGTQYNGSAGLTDNIVLHVPELRQNNWSAFNYTFNCTTIPPPLNISTQYSNSEFNINTKVLAGHDWTINQSARNDLTVNQQIRNINITMMTQGVDWNGSLDNFTFSSLFAEGDNANVAQPDNRTWYWIVNGGSLSNPGDSQYIVYNVTAPVNVPTSATYMALKESLQYEVWYLASNLNITNVKAVSDLDTEFDKQIVRPSQSANDSNVTWEVRSNISVPINISYNLTKVTVWVTSNMYLNETANDSISGNPLEKNYTPGKKINDTTEWYLGPGGDSEAWRFNYSDESVDPPIVWLMPQFTIMDAYNQLVYNYSTVNGNDIYMKYIYVVNGYWLQIDKNITSIDDNTYRIQSIVQNIGTAWTPNNTVVTVYDFVPSDFVVWNMNPSNDSAQAVDSGTFNGTTYRWTIPMKRAETGFNSSLGPKYGPLATTYGNYSWNVTYYVNGTGEYKVSELYIVGLDPRKVDGASTHEGITVDGAFGSSSSEVFYITVVFFLIIINVVNFVMTRRINQKLNRK